MSTPADEARRDFDRKEGLFAKGSVPQAIYDRTKATLVQADAAVAETEAALALARERLEDAVLVSPIDGIVAVAHAEGGGRGEPNNAGDVLRALAGFMVHPNVGAVLAIDFGVEPITNARLRAYMEEHGYPLEQGSVVVQRGVAAEGRGRAFIGGVPARSRISRRSAPSSSPSTGSTSIRRCSIPPRTCRSSIGKGGPPKTFRRWRRRRAS